MASDPSEDGSMSHVCLSPSHDRGSPGPTSATNRSISAIVRWEPSRRQCARTLSRQSRSSRCRRSGHRSSSGGVIVSGETVLIPSRTFSAEPAEESVENLGTEARLVLSCWYSRHYSGFVREQATRRIVDVERQWVAPFVVQLLGEYVIEIAEVIEEAVEGLSPKLCQDFARENPSFLQLTRQRVVSYWATFYRSRCSFSDYPPFNVMHRLGIWQGLEGRRLLDRD